MDAILNATIGQLIGGAACIIAALSVFIEFTPIKINPISSFLEWIGRRTNKGLNDRMDQFEDKLKEMETTINEIDGQQKSLEADIAERNAINCRVRILRFSDEIRRRIKHSQESFDQVLDDLDVYEKHCESHPDFKNNKTMMAKDRIRAAYDGCMEQNDFL